MRKETVGNPVAPINTEATRYEDGSLCFFSHVTGPVFARYDPVSDTYTLPAFAFERHNTMTLADAANELGVSRMRISRMCTKGQLSADKINGAMVIASEDVRREKGRRDGGVADGSIGVVAD